MVFKFSDEEVSRLDNKLLVSCPSDGVFQGGLFYVDLIKNSTVRIFEGDCRGIERYRDIVFVVTQSHGVIVLDKHLSVVKTFDIGHLDFHGMRVLDDEFILIVETACDSIGIYRLSDFYRVDEIKISDFCNDKHHINDICVHGILLYISMFSYSGTWKEPDFGYDGVILEYDLNARKIVKKYKENLRFPHSVMCPEEKLIYCGSLDLNLSDEDKTLAQFRGFTRGLAFDGRFYYVGQSSMRHLDQILTCNTNVSMDAGFHIFDSVLRTNRFYAIPAKQIYEILIVNDTDFTLGNTINLSDPGSLKHLKDIRQWNAFEYGHRWMAENIASVILFTDVKFQTLAVRAMSAFPGEYSCQVFVNGCPVGMLDFEAPGVRDFAIPAALGCIGRIEVSFEVQRLWSPAEFDMSVDDRKLGIALMEVRLDGGFDEPS